SGRHAKPHIVVRDWHFRRRPFGFETATSAIRFRRSSSKLERAPPSASRPVRGRTTPSHPAAIAGLCRRRSTLATCRRGPETAARKSRTGGLVRLIGHPTAVG